MRPRRALSHHLVARSLSVSAVLFGLAVAPLDWCPLLMETGQEEGSAQGAPLMRAEGAFMWKQRPKAPDQSFAEHCTGLELGRGQGGMC